MGGDCTGPTWPLKIALDEPVGDGGPARRGALPSEVSPPVRAAQQGPGAGAARSAHHDADALRRRSRQCDKVSRVGRSSAEPCAFHGSRALETWAASRDRVPTVLERHEQGFAVAPAREDELDADLIASVAQVVHEHDLEVLERRSWIQGS